MASWTKHNINSDKLKIMLLIMMELNQYQKAMKICFGFQNDLRVRINFTNALLRLDQSYSGNHFEYT